MPHKNEHAKEIIAIQGKIDAGNPDNEEEMLPHIKNAKRSELIKIIDNKNLIGKKARKLALIELDSRNEKSNSNRFHVLAWIGGFTLFATLLTLAVSYFK